jgi:hypothetical protein
MNQAVDSKKAKNVLHIYTFSLERLERPKNSAQIRITGRAGMGWLVRTGQFSSSDGCLRDCGRIFLSCAHLLYGEILTRGMLWFLHHLMFRPIYACTAKKWSTIVYCMLCDRRLSTLPV